MAGGSSITGAALLPALQGYEELSARWTLLRTTIGAERAEADRELLDRGRAAWERAFKISDVLRAAAGGRSDCFCGGWGYSPLWVAQQFESGLRVDLYASAWGWRPVYCLMCQCGSGLAIDADGLPDGDLCSVCDGAGIAPAWVSAVLRGSPSALDREQTATGWFPSSCHACGGWGRRRDVEGEASAVATVGVLSPSVEAPRAESASEEPTLRREGSVWRATYRGKTVLLSDRVGAEYVACLLDRPNTAVPATELTAMRRASVGVMTAELAIADGLRVTTTTDLGPALNKDALAVYKARLREIGGDIEAAERDNNEGRRRDLVHERELLMAEIMAAVNKRGGLRDEQRDRKRARDSAQKAIKDFLAEVYDVHPELGDHLRASISCGDAPAYQPR